MDEKTGAPSTGFDKLVERFPERWPTIQTARRQALERRQELTSLIEQNVSEVRSDANLIVYGSLARGEWTAKSDLDWSLLVDGQVDADDQVAAKKIQRLLQDAKWLEPGKSGVFGKPVFSHSLVHEIGGQIDTNINTT